MVKLLTGGSVDGINDSLRGNGSASDGVDISQSERGNLADKLGLEVIFESLSTETGSLGETVITDGNGRDRAVGVQFERNSYGASKPFIEAVRAFSAAGAETGAASGASVASGAETPQA